MSDKFVAKIGAAVLFTALIIFIMPLGALFGALAGEVTRWFIGDTIEVALESLGIHGLKLYQLGALAGFLGSFMRTRVDVKQENAS